VWPAGKQFFKRNWAASPTDLESATSQLKYLRARFIEKELVLLPRRAIARASRARQDVPVERPVAALDECRDAGTACEDVSQLVLQRRYQAIVVVSRRLALASAARPCPSQRAIYASVGGAVRLLLVQLLTPPEASPVSRAGCAWPRACVALLCPSNLWAAAAPCFPGRLADSSCRASCRGAAALGSVPL
jgi:hypothetical protein